LIDLHCHSTFSDGSLTPAELAQLAHDSGLSALALTDHDTVAGMPQFIPACRALGVTAVGGVEISVDFSSPGTMHLLGYFIDENNRALLDALSEIVHGRDKRNLIILDNLRKAGMPIELDEITDLAGGDVIGRPHFAQVMLKHGYVQTKEEAFNNWLARGCPAYAERFRLSPADAIRIIRGAGGLAVLAHPVTLKLKPSQLRSTIADLVEYGLNGIEIFYPMHNQRTRSLYLEIARDFKLAVTGGSDFHGAMNPDIQLGRGFGNVVVDDSLLKRLRQHLKTTNHDR